MPYGTPPVLRSGSEGGIHFAPEVHFGKIDCVCRILNSFDCTVASLETKSKSPLHRTGGEKGAVRRFSRTIRRVSER